MRVAVSRAGIVGRGQQGIEAPQLSADLRQAFSGCAHVLYDAGEAAAGFQPRQVEYQITGEKVVAFAVAQQHRLVPAGVARRGDDAQVAVSASEAPR